MPSPLRLIVWPGMPDQGGLASAGERIGRELDVTVVSSNEDLEELIDGHGPFDLICPSDYLVEKLVAAGRLADLSGSFGVNRETLAEWSRHPAYDPDERFSVPLAFGTTGYLYSTDGATAHESWSDIFDPESGTKVGMLDEMREVIGAALILAGRSPNATDPESLAAAGKILERQKPFVHSMSSDDFTGPVETGDLSMHQAWSGPASMAVHRSEGLGYTVPSEGALLWVTTAAIPADAQDPEGAKRLLTELMDPEIAALAVSNGGYSTPNCEARDLLPQSLRDDRALFPDHDTITRCLTLTSLTGEEEESMLRLWRRFAPDQVAGTPERAVDSRA